MSCCWIPVSWHALAFCTAWSNRAICVHWLHRQERWWVGINSAFIHAAWWQHDTQPRSAHVSRREFTYLLCLFTYLLFVILIAVLWYFIAVFGLIVWCTSVCYKYDIIHRSLGIWSHCVVSDNSTYCNICFCIWTSLACIVNHYCMVWFIQLANVRDYAGCAGKTVRSLENACHTW